MIFFSDVLCVWAYIAQARVDEVSRRFSDSITLEYRFCSVFGDTAHKIGVGWENRGGYTGFGAHIREVVEDFDYAPVHEQIWQQTRPRSSAPAHLLLKAVQRVDNSSCDVVLRTLRRTFFEDCSDIASWPVLRKCLEAAAVPVKDVQALIDNGTAHADLEADYRAKDLLMVQGSPTFILNDGRQKLYGNVGYSIIEANINELLRSPAAGSASWC